MRTDAQIKEDVLQELAWKSLDNKTQIGVIVKDGIVTLTGVVDSYSKKVEVENAAKSVFGVKAIAEDIDVRLNYVKNNSDTDVAETVVNAFKWNSIVPGDKIKIKVEDGWVYLTGEVEKNYERQAAVNTIANLNGVTRVINNITLKPAPVKIDDIKNRITNAFKRSATLDSKNIHVEVDGNEVTLTGTVHSLQEKDEARNAVYWAPGVTKVNNKLKVAYYPEYA